MNVMQSLFFSDALVTTLSALYGKLLVVMGIAFPMAEVISTYIPPSFYEAFYLYLYIGSMLFLMYMYIMMCKDGKPKQSEFLGLSSFKVVFLFTKSFCTKIFFIKNWMQICNRIVVIKSLNPTIRSRSFVQKKLVKKF